jgi:DNA-directed RNA polymerase specialized sigma24 family protein
VELDLGAERVSDLADQLEPSAARLLALHARVVDGDRVALNPIVGEVWIPLCRRLRQSFPSASADLAADASNDAILTYAARPPEFDVGRGVPLDHFLYGIAARILRDRIHTDRRRDKREGDYAAHILQAYGHQVDDRATSRAAVQEARRALALVCGPTELAAALAWLDEDDTGIVAVRLGVSHLSTAEQRREVRRFTARVIKRLRRHFGGDAQLACREKSKNVNG